MVRVHTIHTGMNNIEPEELGPPTGIAYVARWVAVVGLFILTGSLICLSKSFRLDIKDLWLRKTPVRLLHHFYEEGPAIEAALSRFTQNSLQSVVKGSPLVVLTREGRAIHGFLRAPKKGKISLSVADIDEKGIRYVKKTIKKEDVVLFSLLSSKKETKAFDAWLGGQKKMSEADCERIKNEVFRRKEREMRVKDAQEREAKAYHRKQREAFEAEKKRREQERLKTMVAWSASRYRPPLGYGSLSGHLGYQSERCMQALRDREIEEQRRRRLKEEEEKLEKQRKEKERQEMMMGFFALHHQSFLSPQFAVGGHAVVVPA